MRKMGIMILGLLLVFPTVLKAHGRDITISGKVVTAVMDDATGQVYILQPEHQKGPLPAEVQAGGKVTLSGDERKKDGHLFLRIEKVG